VIYPRDDREQAYIDKDSGHRVGYFSLTPDVNPETAQSRSAQLSEFIRKEVRAIANGTPLKSDYIANQ
jgi:hypothetical protein